MMVRFNSMGCHKTQRYVLKLLLRKDIITQKYDQPDDSGMLRQIGLHFLIVAGNYNFVICQYLFHLQLLWCDNPIRN